MDKTRRRSGQWGGWGATAPPKAKPETTPLVDSPRGVPHVCVGAKKNVLKNYNGTNCSFRNIINIFSNLKHSYYKSSSSQDLSINVTIVRRV